MTSPTEEGGDPADECNNSEVALNDCNAEIEPSFADPNRAHQVETDQIDRQPSTPVSQEANGPQAVENIELEVQKTEKEPQEENSKKKPLLIQIPIPRKWVFLMSGLGRITSLSIQVEPTDKNNPDSSNFYSDKVEGETNSLCHATINYKIAFQLSISWKIPFISNHDIRRMILHLLCERYISQAGNRPNAMWMKQKYVAFLPRPNGLTNGERAIIFGRPLRLYYHRPITDRITPGKFCKSGNTKGKDGFHIFIRPVFCVPRAQLQNTFNRKAFEDHMRSHPNMPIVIIGTNNSWKYLCPLCGNSFSTWVEFRQHPCSFREN
uniref:CPX chromosome region candidate 1 n=1 Tax=Loxodonta africana TaxID=9785 RepID=G3UC49_LOXAF